jgi:hypothetical protein
MRLQEYACLFMKVTNAVEVLMRCKILSLPDAGIKKAALW